MKYKNNNYIHNNEFNLELVQIDLCTNYNCKI